MKGLPSDKIVKTAAMSSGRRPKLIAAVFSVLSDGNPFIHVTPNSFEDPGSSARTLWEPDPKG